MASDNLADCAHQDAPEGLAGSNEWQH